MDYTVFLLASVKEHFERTGAGDARQAMINAAAVVMVLVFFTFSLAGVLPEGDGGDPRLAAASNAKLR